MVIAKKTLIKEKEGYLGQFHNPSNPRLVEVEQEQTFFVWNSPRPWHDPPNFSNKDQEDKKHDVQIPFPFIYHN